MKHYWLHKNNHNRLILFFCGWANDPHPFLKLKDDACDVLMFYDYRNFETDLDIKAIVAGYEETHVLAWSIGVFVANTLLQNIPLISATAVNGTLKAIDDHFGIPPAIFEGTIQNFSERNRDKFFRRMCVNPEAIAYFSENKPQRELQEQLEELQTLQNEVMNAKPQHNIFDSAIIGRQDSVFPPQNMIHFWTETIGKENLIILDAPHFLFNQYKRLSDLCQFTLKNH
jgi:biotin synthesis protein BioG